MTVVKRAAILKISSGGEYKIEEIVREWELQTKSSFTLFTAPKHFGQLGKSIVIVTGAGGAGINFMGGGGGDDIILLL